MKSASATTLIACQGTGSVEVLEMERSVTLPTRLHPFRVSACVSHGSAPVSLGAEGLDQGGDDLVQVADDGVVGVGEDGGAGVGVDGDDVLRAGAAGDVLDGTADAAGQVELRGDLGAGLADLLAVRAPAFGGDHP